MKIENVKINNFMGVKFIDVAMDGNVIAISGANGQGKSSFCKAIYAALRGKDRAIIKPIRDGETEADVEIELDGYTVKRIMKEGRAEKLTITPNGETESIKSPKKWLDKHFGSSKIDPSEFSKMSEPEWRELLIDLSGIKLDTYDDSIERNTEERKGLKRDLAKLKQLSPEEVKTAKFYETKEESSVKDLNDEYILKQKENNDYIEVKAKLDANLISIAEMKASIEVMEAENIKLMVVPEASHDLEKVIARIKNVDDDNTNIRASKSILSEDARYKAILKEIKDRDNAIKVDQTEKKNVLEYMELPVAGLKVDDDGVSFNGIPFLQINDSQKIIIGVLISLALMPEDNPIKFIYIQLGSLLDDKALAYLEKIATEQNAQIVVEFVGGDKGMVIEDGEIIN